MEILQTNRGKNSQGYASTHGNQITKKYYDFLVGEINRGVNHQDKSVTKILRSKAHNYITYHLDSNWTGINSVKY